MFNLGKVTVAFVLLVIGSGCAATTPYKEDMYIPDGPKAVSQIHTPYDDLLSCLGDAYKGKQARIGVGSITDETGKFAISDTGNGKFITQGAGDIVQSALLQSKVTKVVNRRDPRIMQLEAKFGRKMAWIPSDFHITGSINSLDFIPGGGIEANVWGVGAKYRQHRMLIGMDIFLTNTRTSEVIAHSSIFKQLVADEMGAGVGRFFGTTLVAIDLGEQHREATHFALRNMLKMSVYELLSNLYNVTDNGCAAILEAVPGVEEARVSPEVSVDPF